MMTGMMLWMVLFWAVIIGAVAWFVTSLGRRSGDTAAIDVLRARLASGDIDVEDFGRRERALDGSGGRGRFGTGRPITASLIVVGVLIVVPVIVMAANGWDMWDMHGRGRNTSGSPVVQGGSRVTVRIQDFGFQPGNVEVPVGASVTWTNEDSAPHDATDRGDAWKTERLSEGESDTLTFDSAGEYDYYCSIHTGMKARLIVR